MGINQKSHEWEESKTKVRLWLAKSNQLYDYVSYSGITNILLSCMDVEWIIYFWIKNGRFVETKWYLYFNEWRSHQ